MKAVSVFAGIGGFDIGFERAGMEVGMAEWLGRRLVSVNNSLIPIGA